MTDAEIWTLLEILFGGIVAIVLTIRAEGRRSRARLHRYYAEKHKAVYERGRAMGRIEGRSELQMQLLQRRIERLGQIHYGDGSNGQEADQEGDLDASRGSPTLPER